MRRRAMAILAALALVGAGVLAGAGPAAAITEPAPGAPCDSSDLGRRQGWPETVNITPTITHFKAYYVTAGSTGQQVVQLTYQQQITVAVLSETSISATFGFKFLTSLVAFAKFAVTNTTQSTTAEQRTLTWNFNQPGYYGVYSGMQKVSGQMSALHCLRVQKSDGTWVTEWNRRASGSYSTWGRDQEGVVRCEDEVPANTVMRAAQIELGCAGRAAQQAARAARAAEAAKPAEPKPAADGRVAAAAPSGYVCEPGYYRIFSTNGLVMDADDGHNGEYVGWVGGISGKSQQWTVCNGPADATGMQPSVLVNRSYNACFGVTPSATATEGARIDWRSCESVPARQKLYLYRDVPGSDLIGIQLAYRGAMAGQAELVHGAPVQQYEGGMPDGSGTFHLTPA